MKVSEVPKYTCVETVMQLTRRQRAILYKKCVGGRSCYLVDVNYYNGGFFEDCFDQRGVFVGEHVTHRYMSKENKIDKRNFEVLKVIKNKKVNIGWLLVSFKHYAEYQEALDNEWTIIKQVSSEPLTKSEFNLLKEWLEQCD